MCALVSGFGAYCLVTANANIIIQLQELCLALLYENTLYGQGRHLLSLDYSWEIALSHITSEIIMIYETRVIKFHLL